MILDKLSLSDKEYLLKEDNIPIYIYGDKYIGKSTLANELLKDTKLIIIDSYLTRLESFE